MGATRQIWGGSSFTYIVGHTFFLDSNYHFVTTTTLIIECYDHYYLIYTYVPNLEVLTSKRLRRPRLFDKAATAAGWSLKLLPALNRSTDGCLRTV